MKKPIPRILASMLADIDVKITHELRKSEEHRKAADALRQDRAELIEPYEDDTTATPALPTPDAMPLGWRPKHWEHVQRKGKDDNGGALCPRRRRPYMETEERLYPGNDHATRARRLGIGRLNPKGPGAWLTIPECWQIEMARRVSA